MPKFSELVVRESHENLAFTEYAPSPIVRTLNILLKVLPARVLLNYFRNFLDKHKSDTSLVGMKLCNPHMERCIRIEFALFKNRMLKFFISPSYRDSLRDIFENGGDFMHFPFLFRT